MQSQLRMVLVSMFLIAGSSCFERTHAIDPDIRPTTAHPPEPDDGAAAQEGAADALEGAADAQEGERGFVEPGRRWQPTRGIWYLGVYGNFTPTGLFITQVFPGSPALRAGLEPGDRIVNVNGKQVGMVNGATVPIDRALQSYVGPSGQVRLLVQDHRTARLLNLDLQLRRGRVHTMD